MVQERHSELPRSRRVALARSGKCTREISRLSLLESDPFTSTFDTSPTHTCSLKRDRHPSNGTEFAEADDSCPRLSRPLASVSLISTRPQASQVGEQTLVRPKSGSCASSSTSFRSHASRFGQLDG
jgi:hypothetical protein